jgi:hypothetical protein
VSTKSAVWVLAENCPKPRSRERPKMKVMLKRLQMRRKKKKRDAKPEERCRFNQENANERSSGVT